MTYVTRALAVSASRKAFVTETAARTELRKSASTPTNTDFDVFLSHSFEDAEVIGGIKMLIQDEGLTVYVDWIEDAQADRSDVTPATADLLRNRMRHCKVLVYASSKASTKSTWMPWELGYFDGLRRGRVGILPIVQTAAEGFKGQEYLGLYPKYELITFTNIGARLGRSTGLNKAMRLFTDARS